MIPKPLYVCLFILLFSRSSWAQPESSQTTLRNIRYGPHERHVYDLWLAKSEKPTPVVVYFHGGGFVRGDKTTIDSRLRLSLLKAGISVASANYRLTDSAMFPGPMHDAARAIQHIRHHAAKHNIDPTKIGASGGSAGGHIALWLAFHDDLADPKNVDPVARQSTRLTTAGVVSTQTSIDPRFIRDHFNTTQFSPAILKLFGIRQHEDVFLPKYFKHYEEASPLNHLDENDVPVMAYYSQANRPLPANSSYRIHIHHPKFGILLKKQMKRIGLDCNLVLREDSPRPPTEQFARFFAQHFRK